MSKPLYQLDWQRQEQPVLSAMTTNQDWCRVTVYSPAVLRMGDTYKMWYLGNRTATRTSDMDLGVCRVPGWADLDATSGQSDPQRRVAVGPGVADAACDLRQR